MNKARAFTRAFFISGLMRLVFILLMVGSAMLEDAQAQLTVSENARVRLQAARFPEPLFARVVQRDSAGMFTVATPNDDARITLSLDAVDRMDVSLGRPRFTRALAGAGIGLLAGGLIGGKLGSDADPEGWGGLIGMVGGASTGFTVGAIAGFAFAPERWRNIVIHTASDSSVQVAIREAAAIRRFPDGTVAVRGERNRRAGMTRGAAALGGLALVFGGIDVARDRLNGGEYISAIASNAAVGAAFGYFISPRKWQRLPHQ